MITAIVSAGSARAAVIFSDGFESSNFSAWSGLVVGGDGEAVVQSAIVKAGSVAAELSESSHSGSKAAVRESFAAQQLDLTATGAFQVLRQGSSGGNVPLFRFLRSDTNRILSVYRQNGTSGTIGVGYGASHFSTTAKMGLNTWYTVTVHAIINGGSSTVEVTLNGVLVYRTQAASLGVAGVSTVQIGNDTPSQPFTLAADSISVQNAVAAPSAPVNTGSPGISGMPQDGQTLQATPGTWTGDAPIAYTYQWLRCGSSGGNCQPIGGATSATYAASTTDVGDTLRVVVTAENSVGTQSATSPPTIVVQAARAAPNDTVLPTILGTAQQGQMLNANPGTWSGTQPISYSYEWRRCDSTGTLCQPIAGATDASYAVTSDDVGRTLVVAVFASNSAGSAMASSTPTAVVLASSTHSDLVALWHMDEVSGTTMFDAVAGHNGSLFNVTRGLPGFLGTAYGFNGSSSYVSVPSDNSLNPGAADATITIHIQTTGTPPPAPDDWDIIRKGVYSSTAGEFKMELQQAGQASCGFQGSSNYSELIAGPKINDGRWHTVQCVKTATAIALVVDGVTFSQPANIGSIANTVPVILASHPGADWYRGALDEASIQIG
jgi:hypothetical protein